MLIYPNIVGWEVEDLKWHKIARSSVNLETQILCQALGPGVTRSLLYVCDSYQYSDQNKFFICYKVSFLAQLNILKSLCLLPQLNESRVRRCRVWASWGSHNQCHPDVCSQHSCCEDYTNQQHRRAICDHMMEAHLLDISYPPILNIHHHHQSDWSHTLVVPICLSNLSSQIIKYKFNWKMFPFLNDFCFE